MNAKNKVKKEESQSASRWDRVWGINDECQKAAPINQFDRGDDDDDKGFGDASFLQSSTSTERCKEEFYGNDNDNDNKWQQKFSTIILKTNGYTYNDSKRQLWLLNWCAYPGAILSFFGEVLVRY